MSARVFCDGCGKELLREQINLLQVATSTCDGQHGVERYELCASCIETARMYFNPTLWPRNVWSSAHDAL